MARLTPQAKKQLSYARDRRNRYGENDKSSRTNIPRSKRRVNRANRRLVNAVVASAEGGIDLNHAETVECHAQGVRPQRWQKIPDIPLGDIVALRHTQTRRAV